MAKYKLRMSYEGTHYVGWQIQPNGPSIQGTLQKGLALLLKEELSVIGSGRTDAGVHALGQVAHFESEKFFDPDSLCKKLNGLLPHDIRIKELKPTSTTFHARFSSLRKHYHYHLWDETTIDPFYRLYRHHLRTKIDRALLSEALSYFVGTHDFATFANVNSQVQSTIRTLYSIQLIPQEGGFRIEFIGEGFLYKMVRNIMGAALSIASGKSSLHELPRLFAVRNRQAIGIPAPACGLFLAAVDYPEIFHN